jgi:hypothetical protein
VKESLSVSQILIPVPLVGLCLAERKPPHFRFPIIKSGTYWNSGFRVVESPRCCPGGEGFAMAVCFCRVERIRRRATFSRRRRASDSLADARLVVKGSFAGPQLRAPGPIGWSGPVVHALLQESTVCKTSIPQGCSLQSWRHHASYFVLPEDVPRLPIGYRFDGGLRTMESPDANRSPSHVAAPRWWRSCHAWKPTASTLTPNHPGSVPIQFGCQLHSYTTKHYAVQCMPVDVGHPAERPRPATSLRRRPTTQRSQAVANPR